MSDLLGVYIDGETKTGKGAASKVIAGVLKDKDLQVYYDVAGDFYRRYVAHVRRYLNLGEDDILPSGKALEDAARIVHDKRLAFEEDETLGDLQRPSISKSVSVLGELATAQRAGDEWWVITAKRAQDAGADVLGVDAQVAYDEALEEKPEVVEVP